MEKHYIGDDDVYEAKATVDKPKSIEDLRNRIADMSILAEVEIKKSRVLVRVHGHGGTNQYMASGMSDRFWLNRHCLSKKVSGDTVIYYFSFE